MLNTGIIKHSLNFCVHFYCKIADLKNMGFEVTLLELMGLEFLLYFIRRALEGKFGKA